MASGGIDIEKVWKVFTVLLGAVIIPLAGWVWTTNVTVAEIKNDLSDAEEVIVILGKKLEEAEANSRSIISIEKDIEYMKTTLERIERFVTQ